MLWGPKLPLGGPENLFAAVRGSRLVKVAVEAAGIPTGAYVLCAEAALVVFTVGDDGESMTGDAGDS